MVLRVAASPWLAPHLHQRAWSAPFSRTLVFPPDLPDSFSDVRESVGLLPYPLNVFQTSAANTNATAIGHT